MRFAILFWPGFDRAWRRGEIYACVVAVTFGVCLNVAWFASFHWPQWLSGSLRFGLWSGIAVAAIVSFARGIFQSGPGTSSISSNRKNIKSASADKEIDPFCSAQNAYLRGEYFEAEAALHPIFTSGREDVEAALLLSGILRRTDRIDAALQTLERLSKLDASFRWVNEIQREREICIRKRVTDR